MPTRTITEEDENRYRRQFGEAVLARRQELDETQEEVARAVGVAHSVYRSWEKGRATPRGLAMLRLCQHFGWTFPVGDTRPSFHLGPDLRKLVAAPRSRANSPMVGAA